MILAKLINSVIIIVCAYILLKLIQYFLKKIFEFTRFDVRYENTLNSLLCSVTYYVIFVLTIILLLREFNIVDVTKFGTLVTGASIVGLIAGVASQSILKDIFNGFFLIFEKQMQVGDFVLINEKFRGTIEEIGLRSTSLRDWDLRRVTIPNGNINSIRNYSRKNMRIVVSVRVPYQEDPLEVIKTLEEVCNTLNERHKEFLCRKKGKENNDSFSVYGVTDIEEKSVGAKYTITGIVQSHKYFTVLKDAKLQILITFRENGINIAYPTHINIVKQNMCD
ncbi:mechanosensitive ion channel family protein [Paraclostridium ghonii]|uniref:mechanosensitive ion channel family protein n=1 Tax=Paraclostridium ghonii TaxID=29358 RepID=UPI0027D799B3|nr:mechanosensitive ion channel family protein [Paeniclostridium ghonii]